MDCQRLANRIERQPNLIMQRLFVRIVFGTQPLVLELAPQDFRDIRVLLGSDAASTSAKTKRTGRAAATLGPGL